MGRVAGKVCVVTGAASGIGAACATMLAREGATVVVADINAEGAAKHAEELRRNGFQASSIALDLGDEASIVRMIEHAATTHGGLDILLNNAAATHMAGTRDAPVESMDVGVWDDTMRINLRGTMLAIRSAIPLMRKRRGGSIINTSSGAAAAGALGYTAYAVSKAAIEALTRYVATQHGKEAIRCNAITPGLIVTPATVDNYAGAGGAMMLEHHLTPRLGTPDDVANAVVYLGSDEAAFVTGQVLFVDGGLLAHQPYVADERRARKAAQPGA